MIEATKISSEFPKTNFQIQHPFPFLSESVEKGYFSAAVSKLGLIFNNEFASGKLALIAKIVNKERICENSQFGNRSDVHLL